MGAPALKAPSQMVLAPVSSSHHFITHQYLGFVHSSRVSLTVVQFHDLHVREPQRISFSVNECECNQLKDEPIVSKDCHQRNASSFFLFFLFFLSVLHR